MTRRFYIFAMYVLDMKTEPMEILSVEAAEYARALVTPATDVFLTPAFNELNRRKVDDIEYLLFRRGGKTLGGLIGGLKDNLMAVPFSAPYGGLKSNGRRSFSTIRDMAQAMTDKAKEKGLTLDLTFPAPVITDSTIEDNNRFIAALQGCGARIGFLDVNQHINLRQPVSISADIKRRSALTAANGAEFSHNAFDEKVFREVYDVIALNHKIKGYPMRMSPQDYIDTSKVVEIHLFSVTRRSATVAGAICYVTRKGVVQLISWGDLPETRSETGYMSLLATGMIEWIKRNMTGIDVLDMGPSSSIGMPAAGLCDFKNNLGAVTTLKTSMIYNPSLT